MMAFTDNKVRITKYINYTEVLGMKNHRTLLVVLTLIVLVTGLAGCGNNSTESSPTETFSGVKSAVSAASDKEDVFDAFGGTGATDVKVYLLGNTDNNSTTFKMQLDDNATHWFYLYKVTWKNDMDNQKYYKYVIDTTAQKIPGYEKQKMVSNLKEIDTDSVENSLNYKTLQQINFN